MISKAKKHLKVIRHLLLLSREQIDSSRQVAWILHPDSQVWKLSEVTSFWQVNGHGQKGLNLGECGLVSTSSTLMNSVGPEDTQKKSLWRRMCQAVCPAHQPGVDRQVVGVPAS